MHPIEHLRERVEAALAAAHLHAARLDDDAWAFARGDSRGLLHLANYADRVENAIVAVRVPVARVPADREAAFARRLLAMNLELAGLVAFGVDEEGVAQVVGARLVGDLPEEGVGGLAAMAASAADRYRKALVEEFGSDVAIA